MLLRYVDVNLEWHVSFYSYIVVVKVRRDKKYKKF